MKTDNSQPDYQSQIDQLTQLVKEQNEKIVTLQNCVTNLNSQLLSPTVIDPLKEEYIQLYTRFVKDAEVKILYYSEIENLRLKV